VEKIQQAVDDLYKQHFGKIIASLLYSFTIDPETAEDLVHDSFATALTHWRTNGIPENKAGWIYTVCKNKALDRFRREKRFVPLNTSKLESFEAPFPESATYDQSLRMLFACAHPDLSPKSQVAITLKYVVNLKVDAIANSLGMTTDGVEKLLFRARQKIRSEKILLEEPHALALIPRLPIVHKIIYLTFNEGYKSFSNNDILRDELCEEALLLNKALLDSSLANKETLALHALMLLNSARFKSRFSDRGDMLELEKQDRSRWNKDLIFMGLDFLKRSQDQIVSTYHLEAAIAAVHCTSATFDSTDWKTIAGLYGRLLHDHPNPFIELNYAIAQYYNGEKAMAFDILNNLLRHPVLSRYHPLNTALGKLHHQEGNDELAGKFLLSAFQQASLPAEKKFIQKLMDELGPSARGHTRSL